MTHVIERTVAFNYVVDVLAIGQVNLKMLEFSLIREGLQPFQIGIATLSIHSIDYDNICALFQVAGGNVGTEKPTSSCD
ncbi:hypothetical protein GALL_277140 [mine drainage metagenome]|uniref:Uncharacterized protein n=1 Tax=mine drainage metagenome TaxID=410659 RepID=A0A1J5R328_9ZZZZ